MFYPEKVQRLQEIEPEIAGGTTAVVAVIVNGFLYVANTGDSRAIVVRNTENGSIIDQVCRKTLVVLIMSLFVYCSYQQIIL